ncbi:MAG: glycosyltransferase, partial [Thermodesulfobacteriota bacterium]|nr:glycosyltransferase [Thermodesulfobacteriota bacterium]
MKPEFSFRDIHKELRPDLLMGSTGKHHLAALADKTLSLSARPGCENAALLLDLGVDLILAAWENDPLDMELAGHVIACHKARPLQDKSMLPALQALAERQSLPKGHAYFQRLVSKGNLEKVLAFTRAEYAKDRENLFWRWKLSAVLMHTGDFEGAEEIFQDPWPEELLPVRAKLLGDVYFCEGKYDLAAKNHLADGPKPLSMRIRGAEALSRLGETEKAVSLWTQALSERPWDTSLILRLYDRVTGRNKEEAGLPGKAAILLYTFNKADEIDATLKSLGESELGDARIRVLNNGSTDRTGEVLSSWEERFGKNVFSIVDLPINIGAPAARNWLMSLPEVRAMDFIIFLDDDVELPKAWLKKLGAAIRLYPEAGVWGCRVKDHANPPVIQSADLHLVTPQDESMPTAQFSVSDLQAQEFDFGQFDYLRPCVSVTGCCHVFKARTLFESGEFDIRFSPTQFDDLDHDLRLSLEGKLPVYQGHLSLAHKKSTGRYSFVRPEQEANMRANSAKLYAKYSRDEVRKIMAYAEKTLESDLLQ